MARKCQNPLCNESFMIGSLKKKYCDNHCKNQAAYQHKLTHYIWEVEVSKARIKNIKILEHLFNINVTSVTLTHLKSMGYVDEACYVASFDERNKPFFRYGNLAIQFVTAEHLLITKIEE